MRTPTAYGMDEDSKAGEALERGLKEGVAKWVIHRRAATAGRPSVNRRIFGRNLHKTTASPVAAHRQTTGDSVKNSPKRQPPKARGPKTCSPWPLELGDLADPGVLTGPKPGDRIHPVGVDL